MLNLTLFLDIRMKLFKTEEHILVTSSLVNMAMIYDELGEKVKALEINQKVLG
jgi:hypothetical protein